MASGGNQYLKLLNAVESYYGSGSDQWQKIITTPVPGEDFYKIASQTPGVDIITSADGKPLSYEVKDVFQRTSSAAETVTGTTPAIGAAADSNTTASVVADAASISIPAAVKTSTTGKLEVSSGIGFATDTGATVAGVVSAVSVAAMAVSVGALLGKTVDKALYNANPDFWDSHNMSTLNPDTWNSITADDDSISARVVNTVLHLSPDEKKSATAYVDADTLGYLAWYLAEQNVFASEKNIINGFESTKGYSLIYDDYDFSAFNVSRSKVYRNSFNLYFIFSNYDVLSIYRDPYTSNEIIIFVGNRGNKKFSVYNSYDERTSEAGTYYSNLDATFATFTGGTNSYTTNPDAQYLRGVGKVLPESDIVNILMYNSDIVKSGGVAGISVTPGTKTLDETVANAIDSPQTALAAILGILPALATAAIVNKVPLDDGTVKDQTLYPVPMPIENPDAYGEPVGWPDYFNQNSPEVDPETKTLPDALYDVINKLIGKDATANDAPDIGGGDVPSITYPSGQASSLWKIYNPTLAQIDAFGAWLWSDDFIEQIKKLFSDPMQAIIGLHKIYCTPSTGGTQNIKVGYLDTGVASKVVSDQYNTIDCGSVNLREYFGNVLDYSPFTNIHLYLPFIGIVPLNPADVIRSTISIKYGIDVLSGACLANVNVQRDNAGGILYTYSGNAAVTYPLSSGSYIGMVANIASIAGSAVAGFASGGVVGAVASGAVSALRSGGGLNVQYSGGFSGNAGAMGNKKPYLIISRPQSEINAGFPTLQGYPSNTYTALSACSGFTQVKAVHVDSVTDATQEEKEMIENALKSGVII